MQLQDFINKYTGQRPDYDGKYGAQCVDLFRFYLKEVLEIPQSPASVIGAYQIFDKASTQYFEKIKNTPSAVPHPGDIIIWNENHTKNGHVAICTSANIKTFDAFQQNAPKADVNGKTGSPGNIQRYSYKNVTGWLRPKVSATPVPPPVIINPPTTMTLHKILVLLNGVQPLQLTALKQAVEHVKSRVAAMGDISIEVDYLVIDRIFNTESGPTTTPGATATWVKASEIGEEGRKGEIALSKEFDLVTLIYDPTKIIGGPVTNPVENPVTIEGFNINQIPTSWFNTDFDSARLFFYHEMLHSWYYIINSELGAGQTDQVHNFTWPPGVPGPTLENQMQYFDSLALSLKPYWPALATNAASPEERKTMLAFKYQNTIYLAIFAKFVAVSDQDTFLELGGNWNYVKELTTTEFNSIVKPYLAAKTIIG